MPTAKEHVPNKPITGTELAEVIKRDVADVLARDGFYTSFIAYPRCAYEVRITLHMDNPVCPRTETIVPSRRPSMQTAIAQPEMASIETLPLASPSPESVLQSSERHRDVPSPNAARVSNGLPIDVTVREGNGATTERKVLYPTDYPLSATDAPPPVDRDATADERARLKLPPEPSPEADPHV